MAIPTATHSITVARQGTEPAWGQAEPEATELARGVRAVIGSPSGDEDQGTQGDTILRMTCDDVPGLDHRCQVTDEATDVVYDVVWAVRRPSMLGVHYEAGLQLVQGAAVAR